MSDTSVHAAVHGAPTSFIRKYVFSLDHKIIGLQYYALALVAVVVGMVLSWIMRVHLVWPNAPIPGITAFAGRADRPAAPARAARSWWPSVRSAANAAAIQSW